MNQEFPDVQTGFRKDRGTRDQIANICWSIGKAREFQKSLYCFTDQSKYFDCVDYNKLENSEKDGNTSLPYPLPVSWETCMQVKKQQLELDIEQWAGSKLGKEYVKAALSPCIFYLYAEWIIWNAGLDE